MNAFSSALTLLQQLWSKNKYTDLPVSPHVYEQSFAEEIRQKAFKSHINLKLASALLCSVYFYVANFKIFTTFVFEVIH